VWRIFPRVPHFLKCGAFFHEWRIFLSVAHLSTLGAFIQVWRIFLGVAHFFKCGAYLVLDLKVGRKIFRLFWTKINLG